MDMATAAPAGAFRYRAFISYRHADKAWGDWLHRALESYRVPKDLVGTEGDAGIVPARLTPVFRDREELGAAADLAREIDEALQASANLIVICSPGAAASRWVNEEILRFKRLERADRIFAIIVAGEPGAADAARECFPPALKFELDASGALSERRTEPIAADARDSGDGRENAKLKVIAGLLGVDYDRLRRREQESAGVFAAWPWRPAWRHCSSPASRRSVSWRADEPAATCKPGSMRPRRWCRRSGKTSATPKACSKKVLIKVQQRGSPCSTH